MFNKFGGVPEGLLL